MLFPCDGRVYSGTVKLWNSAQVKCARVNWKGVVCDVVCNPSVVNGENLMSGSSTGVLTPLVLTSWPSSLTWCWAASTSTWLVQAVLSWTMVVAKGCAADMVVLITNPRAHLHRLSSTPSSPTLHTHYINARAATIELPWSFVVHCASITASTIATSTIATATASATTTTTAIINVAAWSNRLHGLSTSTEITWCMLLPCHDTNCRASLHRCYLRPQQDPDLMEVTRGIIWLFLGERLHQPRESAKKCHLWLSYVK